MKAPSLLLCVPYLFLFTSFCHSFQLFPVRGKTIDAVSEYSFYDKSALIREASDFFVDAFWTGKVGGGAKTLGDRQRKQLQQSQLAEFEKRYYYNRVGSTNRAELFVCRNAQQEVIACAGVEVDSIPRNSLQGIVDKRAPLMSNVAVARRYRRRGLAEELVQAVENTCLEWGYDECYLYVEQRNRAAIKLYQKLGYATLWKDDNAKTLLPSPGGDLKSTPTVIVCMKKDYLRRRSATNFNSLFLNIFRK